MMSIDLDKTWQASQYQRLPDYRPAKLIPRELREHCIIYFEEGLHVQALSLLTSLLVSSSANIYKHASLDNRSTLSYAHIPPPALTALLATLVIHPSVTTHAHAADRLVASNHALHFLYNLNRIVGPVNANLSRAFIFIEKRRAASGRNLATLLHQGADPGNHSKLSSELSDDSAFVKGAQEQGGELPNSRLAQHQSLWACSEDFWHIVGWSFNCAAIARDRWERWKLWLELMLEIIEDDWTERLRLSQKATHDEASPPDHLLTKSVAVHFLAGCAGDANGAQRRRVLRAVFANASDTDLSEFREVFRGETQPKKATEDNFNAFRDVDIDAGDFGDYYDEDDSELEDENLEGQNVTKGSQRQSSRLQKSAQPKEPSRQVTPNLKGKAMQPHGLESLGGYEAMLLRRRLLIMLAQVSLVLPGAFTNISRFVDVLDEFMRPLPLAVYSFILLPSQSCGNVGERISWPPSALSSLLQELARELSAGPRHTDNFLTPQVLQQHYLAFPAKSSLAVDNAKLSILVENMTRLLRLHANIDGDKGKLRRAVEKGIAERKQKVQTRIRKAQDEITLEAMEWLDMSAARLQTLVTMIEDSSL